MENDRVKADTVEEAEVDGELFDLVKNCAADFDDGKLGGVGGICRGGEDAKVAFDLALGTYGVEEASDGVLVSLSIYESGTFA